MFNKPVLVSYIQKEDVKYANCIASVEQAGHVWPCWIANLHASLHIVLVRNWLLTGMLHYLCIPFLSQRYSKVRGSCYPIINSRPGRACKYGIRTNQAYQNAKKFICCLISLRSLSPVALFIHGVCRATLTSPLHLCRLSIHKAGWFCTTPKPRMTNDTLP